jgi:pyrimidine operon attenuation protein/uracil phosphoribosyltransferase
MNRPTGETGKEIMDGTAIDLALSRIAAEIVERLGSSDHLALLGIRRRGAHLGRRLCAKLETLLLRPVLNGVLDITLYRDDLTTVGEDPTLREPAVDFDIDGRNLVLVDDVLYTGRTVRSALRGLDLLGRPRIVQLAVLIDRGHRALPIHADYVGKTVQTETDEIVEVRLKEEDGEERVVLTRRPQASGLIR